MESKKDFFKILSGIKDKQIAQSLERLYQEEKRRSEVLMILLDNLSKPEFPRLIKRLPEQIAYLFQATTSLFLITPEREGQDALVLQGTNNETLKSKIGWIHYLPGEGTKGWVGETAQCLLNGIMPTDFPRYPELENPYHFLAVPLGDGNPFGVLWLARPGKEASFADKDEEFLQEISGKVAKVIEHENLYGRIQNANILEALQYVKMQIHSDITSDEILQLILEQAAKLSDAMNGTLGVVNPETGLLEVKAACGSLKEVYVPPLEKKDKGITRYVVNTGKPYLCQDVTECPYYLKSDSNTLSELCVPIKVGGQTIGDINLESAERKHFSLEHERLLTLFAVYAGAAIVMAQTRWTDELHTLLDIGQELLLISSINDRDDVLNRVISIAADTLPCKRINILLKDTTGKRIVLRATYGGRENFIGQQFYDLDVIDESGMKGEGLTGKVAAGSIEKIRTRAAREMKGEGWKGKYNRPDEGHDEPPGSVPMMILPLRTMNDIVGAIRFTRPSYRADRADGCFNDNDERFALAVAQLIAIAVEIARLFEEKQRGIAEAVHQFTGPLHTIKSNVDYLLDYPVDVTEQREILAEIQGDIVRSIEWMDRIALSEKLRSGYIPLEFQKVPLKNLINEIWNGYCKNAEERGVKFRCHCLPDLTVEVDAQMFREALSNLLSNALKFTPDNTYVIVRAQQMEDNVEIKVFDQGPGLSSEAMERCFELYFSTVPPSGKREGQGLGLFIAQRIVHLHKGNLHASNKNKGRPGAVFTITLPQGDLKCQ